MTRRASPRAQARALFREMSEEGRALRPEPSPGLPPTGVGHPLPLTGEGKEEARRHTNTSAFTSAQATTATERARALYEDTAVTVAEIARRCGVTERTILKYAAKLNWKPRYHWIGGAAGERHRRWRPAEKFAPVKGAGARFVRRAAAGQPFAAGLNALDPQAGASATAACDDALRLARAAEARAAQARHDEQVIAAIAAVGDALAEILAQRRAREKAAERAAREELRAATDRDGMVWRNGMAYAARQLAEYEQRQREAAGPLPPDRFEEAMWRIVAAALARWEACLGPRVARGAEVVGPVISSRRRRDR